MALIDPGTAFTIGSVLFAGASAWGGSLVAIKSVKDSQVEVKAELVRQTTEVRAELVRHTAADTSVQLDLVARLARIEGKLDRHNGIK